jgi:tRNA dimethylallyltransferase
MGPTASGKTGLAIALAQQFPVEIISVDSALVYRDMDIGTAKPDADLLAQAPHHLIDLIPPTEAYSAAQFRKDAIALLADITSRGNVPLLVGGTMLYFKALEGGLSELPEADVEIRSQLDAEAAEVGWPAMHAKLQLIDPQTAARLEPADSQRVQRALEVFHLTGKTMSVHFESAQTVPALPYDLLKIALLPSDRSILHARIAMRFDLMLKQGFEQEVIRLRENYPALNLDLPSMRCVGYRQMWQYLEGEINLDELIAKGVAATRQLAKRQLTWLRGMKENHEMDCLSGDLQVEAIHLCQSFLNSNKLSN